MPKKPDPKTNAKAKAKTQTCPTCNGKRFYTDTTTDENGKEVTTRTPCTYCAGKGYINLQGDR